MRRVSCLAASVLWPIALAAQERPPAAHEDTTSVWLSVTLGPGSSSHGEAIGGQLALWGVRNQVAMVLRHAGASDLDVRDVYDTGVLVGARTSPDYFALAAAAGPVYLTDAHVSGPTSNTLGIGYVIEASGNLRYVGLGVSAFGAISSGHRFFGLGLTAQIGKIQ